MANLEPMPISSLPEGDIQDGDKMVIYRETTGKAYQTDAGIIEELNADLTDITSVSLESAGEISGNTSWSATALKKAGIVFVNLAFNGTFTRTSTTKITTLPEGYRPSVRTYKGATDIYGNVYYFDIRINGEIYIYSNSEVSAASMMRDILTFPTA